MGKTVLILSSSPRNSGNYDFLCDQFMLGTKAAGNQLLCDEYYGCLSLFGS